MVSWVAFATTQFTEKRQMAASDLTPFPKATASTASQPDRNQIQLTLAIANTDMLRSLLVQATPAIARPHQISQIRVSVGAPPDTEGLAAIDAVVEYEHIWCTVSEGAPQIDEQPMRDYRYLTRCQSDLKTLAWRVNLADAISFLSHGGFQEDQIQRILQLPWEGWHRSWWDTFDAAGHLGLPFQRWFRTRCYGDGTYTLQYRDFYSQDAPPCFRGIWQRIPVMTVHAGYPFGEALTSLKQARHTLGADQCLILADSLSDLEAEGYMRQGVSLYSLQQPLQPELTLCPRCDRQICPMNHRSDTHIISCRDYVPAPEPV